MTTRRIVDNEVLLGEVCAALAEGKMVKLRAKGGSMRPFIHGEEDILLLARPTALRRGDIVLARTTAGRFVVHRIIKIMGERIMLAGDANLTLTEECRRKAVAGRVEAIVRGGRTLSMTSAGMRIVGLGRRMLFPLRRRFAGALRAIKSERKEL